LWSYYISTQSPLKGMNRVYLGNVGDYGTMGLYAVGWIDNVQLTVPASPTPLPISSQPTYSINQTVTKTPLATYTPIPTFTHKSPLPGIIAIAALGIIGSIVVARSVNKKS